MSDVSSENQLPIRWWEALSVAVSAYLSSILVSQLVVYLSDKKGINLSRTWLYIFSAVTLIGVVFTFLKLKRISLRHFFNKAPLSFMILAPIFYIFYVLLSKVMQSLVSLLFNANLDQAQDTGLKTGPLVNSIGIFVAIVLL